MRGYYDKDHQIPAQTVPQNEEFARSIARIERNDAAFQPVVSRAKVRSLKNFYEMAVTQPPIPGTVLLFTSDKLTFRALDGQEQVGHLQEPTSKYLIIDGQHRLAALRFYLSEHPEEAKGIDVPCIIFDARSEDFAAEMFVIINSTPTRINKSHLVEL